MPIFGMHAVKSHQHLPCLQLQIYGKKIKNICYFIVIKVKLNKCVAFWTHSNLISQVKKATAIVLCCRNFPLAQTSFYLQLCSSSFAPCLPYKYSSRIKRTPLASWPLMKLGRSISYHSSCVACQAGCGPDETMRAHIRGRGLPWVLPWSLLCPPPACLNNIPEV